MPAKLSLIAGVLLIWIWELGLAVWGDHGLVSWVPVVAGAVLIVGALAMLLVRERR
jgi:uncharacterized membrane protein